VKTLWIWLALVLVGIAAALYFGRSRVETGAANRPWPLGLGTVADAPKRFPTAKENASAAKLVELARRVQIDLRSTRRRGRGVPEDVRESFTDYVRVQLERPGDAIDLPPSDVRRYLEDNAATLDEIRALVLAGEPIVFEADIKQGGPEAPGPNAVGLQQLHRTFVARALIAAREGNPGAWDELHVAWKLAEPMWRRPDTMGVLTASTGARMVNAAARKLPLPAAPWFKEVLTFNYERALGAAQQAEAWRSKTPGALGERLRGMAEGVLSARACDATSPQFEAVREKLGARATPNLIGAWERLMRFRAEREATLRVFQLRSGQQPSPQSQCVDGSWVVTPASFRFSRDIPVQRPQIKYPLEYRK
jgi:hypothetical protein